MTSFPVQSSAARARPPVSPLALVSALLTHRELIAQMTRREVIGRYRGSALGLLWSFFYPLLMLGVYTFAFAYVFKVSPRPQAMAESALGQLVDFAFYAFSGMILLNLFTEVVTRSPTFILANANYVKKVVFPLEVFPYVYICSSLIHAAISLLVLLTAMLAINQHIPLTALAAPLVLLPLALMILGFSWFLASLGVYLRDVAQTIGIITMMLMYLSPVFYTVDRIGNPLIRGAIRFNPLTIPLEGFRWALLGDAHPPLRWCAAYVLASILVASAGFFFFQRTKRGFPDVL